MQVCFRSPPPLKITDDTVIEVGRQLSGRGWTRGNGCGQSTALDYQLRRGQCRALEDFCIVGGVDDKKRPTWEAYRALMAGDLIGLDKQAGVRPVGIGETWLRCFEKCVLTVAGPQAKKGCGTEQICGGLEVRIELGIHPMRLLW